MNFKFIKIINKKSHWLRSCQVESENSIFKIIESEIRQKI